MENVDMNVIGGMCMLAMFLFAVYFLPWGVAACRNHKRSWGVFWLNLLAGWSLIGWIVAISWAIIGEAEGGNA